MNEINSFTFYRDYFNLIDTMPIKDKMAITIAILDYVFKDKDALLSGHNLAIFNTLKHQIDKSKNKSKNAKKVIPNENQIEIKPKSNENQNHIKIDNKTSVLSFIFYISNFKFINNNTELIKTLENWFKYKQEKKHKYTETGLKTLLKKVDNNVEKYGTDIIVDLIEYSIANNYQGIIWEKLNDKQPIPKVLQTPPKVEEELTEEEKNELQELRESLQEFKDK